MFYKRNVKLSQYTTFKIGGIADYFLVAQNRDELAEIWQWAQKKNLPFFVLGGGSNILIPDDGIRGLVIKIEFEEIEIVKNKMSIQAGCQLSKAVNFAYQNNCAGLEWAVGIPGRIGGAIVGNAGAYGSSMMNLILEVEVLDLGNGTLKIEKFTKDDCQFSYRESVFKNKKYIILSAVLQLAEKNKNEIKEAMDSYLSKRQQKIPLGNSAGCIFKNIEIDKLSSNLIIEVQSNQPELLKYNKLPVAWLIEKCGLKGTRVGGAQISAKHSNFIINNNNAKREDVIKLIELVEKKTQENFGIKLEREVILWYNKKEKK